MSQKKTLEMVRSGEFDIRTYGSSHCGISHFFKIKYHLKCTCSHLLDSRGFLFDQLNIQSFFDSIKRTSLSCERLTVVCSEQLLAHVLTENPTCQMYRLDLTLSPEPFLASMTHSLENNKFLTKPVSLNKSPGKPLIKSGKKHSMIHRLSYAPVAAGSKASTHKHEPSHKHYIYHE